jgi:hypothetical protein
MASSRSSTKEWRKSMTVRKDKAREALLEAGGHKEDQGKDRWDLVAYDTLKGMVKVLTFGVVKYRERNWEVGMKWGRVYGALLRHLADWWMSKLAGTDGTDPETGLSHLDHAQCCLHFLATYEKRGVGEDDRPTKD